MPTANKAEMTAAQSKENLDELLEMQVEEAELARKATTAAEAHKQAKAAHELKQNQIIDHLAELNQELPLFDKPEEVPFPFPLPEGVHEATLANVAADPTVTGLSIGLVKFLRGEMSWSKLGDVEKHLKAEKPMPSDQQDKAKKDLGRKLGANNTTKLLRAIHSFTTGRKKGKPTPKADPVPAEPVAAKPAATGDWRDKYLADVEAIPPKTAQLCAQMQLDTVGKALAKCEAYMNEKPDNPPKNYLASRMATYLGLKEADAAKVIKAVYDLEEAESTKKGAA